ncbi:hypothetical protein [Nocardia lijiangensis]|uniref:hypothetical protein n=1 Tax=Nocardia lijiangensis TaxID=299618 RepID=UPI000A816E15|nr:hypothetical protein [Nocardia lijiangensis]
MASENDAKDNEADRPGSQFGPPLSDFGPPTADFGPSVGGGFGPPLSEFDGPQLGETGAQWPEPAGDHPNVGWRPAAEAPPVPATPPQYRAPDATVYPDTPPAPPSRPAPAADFERDVSNDQTVRHTTASTPAPSATAPNTTAPTGGAPERWWNSASESGEVPKPPSEPRKSDSGLSWADDPIAKRLAPTAPVAASSSRSGGGNTRWIVLGVAAALAVLIGLVVTIVAVNGGGGDEGTTAAPPPVTSAAGGCPPARDGNMTRGNGAGSTDSGPDAILGFQYAFYVERSGERVRTFVAPDAENISTGEIIQKAINDHIPKGTTHCLWMFEVGPGTYEVDLREHRPDGSSIVYKQTVTTVQKDGKTLVSSIKERP